MYHKQFSKFKRAEKSDGFMAWPPVRLPCLNSEGFSTGFPEPGFLTITIHNDPASVPELIATLETPGSLLEFRYEHNTTSTA
jgi:hypothetical protein